MSDDSVHVKLVPYPATVDWKASEKKAFASTIKGETAEKIQLNEVAAVIKNNFERKIKHVVVNNNNATILPALAAMRPAAAMLSLIADPTPSYRRSTSGMFGSIAEHFPAIQRLVCDVGRNAHLFNVGHLEKLVNLSSLFIRNKHGEQQKFLPKLIPPNLVELRLGNNILLPADQANLLLPSLTLLEFEGYLNALQLSTFVPVLNNLTQLTTMKLPTEHVKPFLQSVLPVAHKLKSLTIDLSLTTDSESDRQLLIDMYDTLVAVPSCTATLTIGTFDVISDGMDCTDLVQQRVADVKQRNLKTAITVAFKDNALVWTLRRAGAGGEGVTISATTNDAEADNCKWYEVTWHNIQQKLKIRVSV